MGTNEPGRKWAESLNRDHERKKQTVVKLLRFGWSLFAYYKGTPVIDGDLTQVPPSQAIAALSKQIESGLKDQKAEAATMEGIDLAAGWVMDLLRPSEMQVQSQYAAMQMCRDFYDGYGGQPQSQPAQLPQQGTSTPSYRPSSPIHSAPRPQPRPQPRPRYRRGRLANDDGQWVYIANDADDAANDEEY